MTTEPTRATPQDRAEFALREKLNAVLLHRHRLRAEGAPVPPALEQVIREVRQALGLELDWPTADGD